MAAHDPHPSPPYAVAREDRTSASPADPDLLRTDLERGISPVRPLCTRQDCSEDLHSVSAVAPVIAIRFRVFGVPKTQGSMRAIIHKRTGRAIAIHDEDTELRSWRTLVTDAARQAHRGLLDGPLGIGLVFFLPIPTSRPEVLRTDKQRAQWALPHRRPDADKLTRAILDSLTGVLFHDDAQIVSLLVRKVYGAEPGVEVVVEALSDVATS